MDPKKMAAPARGVGVARDRADPDAISRQACVGNRAEHLPCGGVPGGTARRPRERGDGDAVVGDGAVTEDELHAQVDVDTAREGIRVADRIVHPGGIARDRAVADRPGRHALGEVDPASNRQRPVRNAAWHCSLSSTHPRGRSLLCLRTARWEQSRSPHCR
jgi:hypothetical protein